MKLRVSEITKAILQERLRVSLKESLRASLKERVRGGLIERIKASLSTRSKASLSTRSKASLRQRMSPRVMEELGSISLLIVGLFMAVLVLAMAILDISGDFLAKQELTQLGEAAISSAAHSIDLDRYYRSDRNFVRNSPKGPIYRIPIDCSISFAKFQREISLSALRGKPITILSWNCYKDSLAAQLQSDVPLLAPVPFLGGDGAPSHNQSAHIIATVKAESIVVGS